MSMKSDATIYGIPARALHWLIAALFLYMFASGLFGEALGPWASIPVHKGVGILVLALTALRFVWWVADRARPDDALLAWEKWPSRLVKWALLALSVTLPMSGWMLSSAAGRPIQIFGLIDVPLLLSEPNRELAGKVAEAHEIMAFAAIALVVLHLGAALRHHFMLKDGILRRMWPARA